MFKWVPASHPLEAQGAARNILEKGTLEEALKMGDFGQDHCATYEEKGYFGMFGGYELQIVKIIFGHTTKTTGYEVRTIEGRKIDSDYISGSWCRVFKKIESFRRG